MDIKDVKVGMLVQLNPDYTGYMYPVLQYMKKTGEPLKVVSVSERYVRVLFEGYPLGFYPESFKPYQDPEADMVVWDALEVGEHIQAPATGCEAVKINDTQYVLLGGGGKAFTVLDGKLGRHRKFKLA